MTLRLPATHVAYLHGFRSSPHSAKARQLEAELRQRWPDGTPRWWCPALPPSPREAVDGLQAVLSTWPTASSVLIGSSLGGFYATVLAERLGCAAVVLNPAVDPARDLAPWVGTVTAWHDPAHAFEFRAGFLDELRALAPARLADPGRYLAVIAQGDELLDWREMAARYAGARIRRIEGGDHALTDFEPHLDAIMDFLRVTA